MPLSSTITKNTFLHIPQSPNASPSSNIKRLIFFIPGNPGLISYYHPFLSLLSSPAESPFSAGCVVVGCSLGGFEVSDHREDGGIGKGEEAGLEERLRPETLGFGDRVELTLGRVRRVVEILEEDSDSAAKRRKTGNGNEKSNGKQSSQPHPSWEVILIGHSVGAYIALEVIRLHQLSLQLSLQKPLQQPSEHERVTKPSFSITASVLLTPTITQIALSPRGRIVAPLLTSPSFSFFLIPTLLSSLTCFLLAFLPRALLEGILSLVLGRDAPRGAVETTAAFLGSCTLAGGGGVRQCLSMTADEMREIQGDVWEEGVWGVAEDGEGKAKGVKVVCYFAETDHWVGNQGREEIIRTRGGGGVNGRAGWPRMVVAREGELVHAWCLRQSGFVAGKIEGWVAEILGEEVEGG